MNHGNSPLRTLPEKQSQADALCSFKQLTHENPFSTDYQWVEGHAKEKKGWKNCTLKEKMNNVVDNLCKRALIAGYASNKYISSKFPFEQISIQLEKEKVTGSLCKAFERFWGAKEARQFFHDQHIVHKTSFNLVWWDGMSKVMMGFPKLYRNWITKHVSEFCGTNKQMWYWDKQNNPKCLCCGLEDEHTMHITRCKSPGRQAMLHLSVRDFTNWMSSTGADPLMVDMIESYLLAQDSRTMLDCLPYPDDDLELLFSLPI